MLITYHIQRGPTRTTVSLDEMLSGLLSIKLGHTPDTPEAYAAVRVWIQSKIEDDADPGRRRVSQWLAREAMLLIADKNLSEKYITWLTGI